MSDPVMPSAEVLFIDWALAHPGLVPLHGGRVATKTDAVRPCWRVQRLGNPQTQRWEDAPELQIETWADDEDIADDHARLLVAALPDIRGAHPTGYVTAFRVTLGPMPVPDEDTKLVRYLLDVELRAHPNPGG